MKKDSQYRFNIQFTARTDAEMTAGEFLNTLGRRKSTVIVAAVNEYLCNHPGLLSDTQSIRVSTISADQLEAKIRAIIEEKLSNLSVEYKTAPEPAIEAGHISTDIVDMLDDLDLFSSF